MSHTADCRRRLARALRDESGTLTVFGLFVFVMMVGVGGLAVDVMRQEATRSRLQSTLDRSVLAAASLSQTRDAETVVREYFEKAGFGDSVHSVTVTEGLNYREVQATAQVTVDTIFMRMLGIETLVAPAAGTAEENRLEVEISLVLDVSGSMDSNNRLPRLKVAAKDFVDAVIHPSLDRDTVSVSIVPFAMQVSAGADLLAWFDVANAHTYSSCIDFGPSDFQQTAIAVGSTLGQTAHFDAMSGSKRPSNRVCPTDPNREIVSFSNDAAALKSKIEGFDAHGNTSIDLGTKWGAFLLDPSSRPIFDAAIAAGEADADFSGRPFDYGEEQVMKVLIVMSDGENTTQYTMNPAVGTGPSDVWRDPNDGRFSIRDAGRGEYYIPHRDEWRVEPYDSDGAPANGSGDPVQRSWPEYWDEVTVRYDGYWHRDEMYGSSGGNAWEANATDQVYPSEKDRRTAEICDAAKAQGVTIFTIGFEAPSRGNDVLRACATSPAYFFDVEGLEISEAFAAISSMINQLRLSQ